MSLRQNVQARADRLQQLQAPEESFKNPGQLLFIRTLIQVLRNITGEMVSTQESAPHLLLTAPSGKVYRVRVQDDGTLVTENARG